MAQRVLLLLLLLCLLLLLLLLHWVDHKPGMRMRLLLRPLEAAYVRPGLPLVRLH